jgi:hypothetical protein
MSGNYLNAFRGPDLAQIDQSAYSNALLRNEKDRIPQANQAQDLALQREQQDLAHNNQTISEGQRKTAAGLLAHRFAAISQSANPKVAARQFLADPNFAAAGKMLNIPVEQFNVADTDDDNALRQTSMDWARALGMQVEQQQQFGKPYEHDGALLQTAPDGQVSTVLNRPPQAPTPAAPRAPEPPVSVAGDDGRPVYVSREDAIGRTPYERPAGGLSARDATTARNKLTTIRLARQQIAEAREKFQSIKGTFSAGPAGQFLPTQAGQAFDAKVDTMRGTITGLKRVPGVGAMSDDETRLDQSMLPMRGRYESTTEQQLADLDTMLNYMEQGYGGMLDDAGMQTMPTQGPANSGGWSIVEVKQ